MCGRCAAREAAILPSCSVNIDILYRPPLRRWQDGLARQLDIAGHRVRLVPGSRRGGFPVLAALVLSIERRLYGLGDRQCDPVGASQSQGAIERPADIQIALDGETGTIGRILEPSFGGRQGDAALFAMATRPGAPSFRIRYADGGASRDLVSAILAIEDRHCASRALDQLLRRIVTLLVRAVAAAEPGGMSKPSPASEPGGAPAPHPLVYFARGLTQKLGGRLSGQNLDRWRVGYRRRTDEIGTGDKPTILHHDERARFLADPMPFAHGGRTYVFFEDFPYATRRGLIGMVEIDANGSASQARIVLEETFHLSYPFVFEHDGVIYMLPETSRAKRIQLYRADPFPDRWVPDRVLVDGVVASDATLIRQERRWWMFATLADDGGSTWDALGLFYADSLHGPWNAHAHNPVLVDAGAARPAGAMWHEDGVLMRVTQDCRTGYGRGLAVCRVDRLDDAGFAQSLVRRIEPPPGTGADGIHTLNRTDIWEIVDLHDP